MTLVAAVLAVGLLVALGALLGVLRSRERAAQAARRAAADVEERLRRAETDRHAAFNIGAQAERAAMAATRRAAEAEARHAELPSTVPVATEAQGRLEALWLLTRLATAWEQRHAAGLSTAAARFGDGALGDILAGEVSRIREEAGTPGSVQVSIDPPPDAAEAIVMVHSIQLLLSALARHCQGYDLSVRRSERGITAIVVCEGFDGPDTVADDTTAVLVAVAPAGGDVALDRDPDGRLRAQLSFPASTRSC